MSKQNLGSDRLGGGRSPGVAVGAEPTFDSKRNSPASPDCQPRVEPDREELAAFVNAIFPRASTGSYVSLRAFYANNDTFRIRTIKLNGDLRPLIDKAVNEARAAANADSNVVFCPPTATFTNAKKARQEDLCDGVVLGIEIDKTPQASLDALEKLLGPATVVVESGGVTDEGEAKLHGHWRLTVPARTEAELEMLKEARRFACDLVGGDPSHVPVSHPIRWPGSWHRKGEPRLCRNRVIRQEIEIDLATAHAKLKEAAPPAAAAEASASGEPSDLDGLIKDLITGESYHEPITRIAAKYAGHGLPERAINELLKALMNSVPGPHDAKRWQPRYDEIPRAVATAVKKFAHGDDLARLLTDLSIIQLRGSVRIAGFDDEGILNLMRKEGFMTFYANLGDLVRGATKSQTYKTFFKQARRYTGTVLSSDGADVGKKLNLWKGWAIDPKKGNWSKIRDHMLVIISAGDQTFFDYLLKWCAWMVQNPGAQAEVAIVMRGGKGTGKGLFVRVLMCFFKMAQRKHIRDRKHLVGAFNSHLASCSLLFADEAYWPGQKDAEGALKGLITEREIPIEPKGVDLFMVPNALHIIVAGNEDWIIPASHDERRYAVQDISPAKKGDRGYFNKLVHEIEHGGAEAMLYDLLAMDLKGWHPRDDVPQTKALDRQKAISRQGIDVFIEQICHDGFLPCAYGNAYKSVPKSDYTSEAVLVATYWNVAITGRERMQEGLWHYIKTNFKGMQFEHARSLTTKLEEWGCISGWHRGCTRGVKFPSLSDLRARFERKHGKQEWSTNAGDWQDTNTVGDNTMEDNTTDT